MSTNLKEFLTFPESWKEDLNTKLKEPSINDNYDDWKIERNYGTEIDVFAVKFNPTAKAGLKVFNDETDKDEPNNLIPNPYPGIGTDKAMIRYNLETRLKASTDANFKSLGFNFDSSQTLTHSYYSIHSNEKTLKEAAVDDIKSFKFIFSVDDVKSLDTNECLALSYLGEIGAKLELSYSDAFSGTISQLSKWIPEGKGLKIKSDAGAKLSFNVQIKDNFYSLIRKNNDGSYKITINKNTSNEVGIKAQAEISVGIEDNDSLKTFVNSILDSLFDDKIAELDGIVENNLNNLSDEQKELLTLFAGKAGLVIDFSEPNLIKERYSTYKKDVTGRITKFLQNKLEAGYSFEYKRVSETNTLFEAKATEEVIHHHLRDIVMFKPSALENAEGIEITKYIFEKTTTITSRLGFALAFGDFKYAWEKLKTLKEEISEDKLNNTRDISVSFIREHSYETRDERKWSVALNAELKTPEVYPKMNHFNFDFTLHWEDRQKKTKDDELIEFVNMATIWKCIPEKDFDEVLKEIGEATVNKEDVKYSCHLHVPKEKMNHLFGPLAEAGNDILADTLAEAMPYANYTFRKLPSLRRLAYNNPHQPIWHTYLLEKSRWSDTKHYADICRDNLPMDPDLARWEAGFKRDSTTKDNGSVSFVGLLEFFSVRQLKDEIQDGARELDLQLNGENDYSLNVLRDNFNKLDDIFRYKGASDVYFHLNFMARLILNVAAEAGLQDLIESVASVEYPNGNTTEKLTYSM